MKTITISCCCLIACFLLLHQTALSQTITGAWKGKTGGMRTELKLVKKGDSLLGTVYYYTSQNHYRRYAVRGYFDGQTNDVVWWDEQLLEDRISGKGAGPMLTVADFNCPGEEKMLLDGSSTERDHKEVPTGPVALEKINTPTFTDEWDYVIENYTVGANHPTIIDSVARLSFAPPPVEMELAATPVRSVAPRPLEAPNVQAPVTEPGPVVVPPPATAAPPVVVKTPVGKPVTPEDKFTVRTNKLQTVIPITAGKKIELRFYDNAQVDGDSIALFLNKKLIFKHIRLTDQAYTIYLNADDLENDNELVMVAENLGSIPPNTSFMVAIVGKKRYEARLHADENSSALIRLIKQDTEP
ncbi:hypothetical protein [Paraflavitalea sp. CAU 1676]|uniref:hypothetical protein n=1 Tax=Paraflavitalea sp. CAU 1676 TaxID=3032598 RepID=UPI0023D9B91F|nr:hypothetical protein [Paraflavitalea sp. CAU 1676]MDF2187369.1 hypothetical protein [Paraflavitalea sp. CAU 1676]